MQVAMERTKKNLGKCVICPVDADGLHYGVITCGGCNFFFRRSIQSKTNYTCLSANTDQAYKCVIGLNFPKCKYCRFQKCLQAGMKKDEVGKRKTKSNGRFIIENS